MSNKIIIEKNDATYAGTGYSAPEVKITSIRNRRSFTSCSYANGDMNEENENWDN